VQKRISKSDLEDDMHVARIDGLRFLQ
jgi:hypothetical protein